ncbi:MAG: glycoside hydrolase family protein [Asticcacaulis sp.]
MSARLKVSRTGVELIKSFEGFRPKATRLIDGRWSIGYGHTYSAREGAQVSVKDAEDLLRFDLLAVVDGLNDLVHTPVNQNQFDALVSFVFNIGLEAFEQSEILRGINEGRLADAAQAIDSWASTEYNGQTYVLTPLVRRRAAEKALFLTPVHGQVETEVPLPDNYALRRQADHEAALQADQLRLEGQDLQEPLPPDEEHLRMQIVQREMLLREEALRQAQALAEARIAEDARLEDLRRQERERGETELRLRIERERQEEDARKAEAAAAMVRFYSPYARIGETVLKRPSEDEQSVPEAVITIPAVPSLPAFELSAQPLTQRVSEGASDQAAVENTLAESLVAESEPFGTESVPSLTVISGGTCDAEPEWSTQAGRVALTTGGAEAGVSGVWKMFTATLLWIVTSVIGLAALGGATASYYQSRSSVIIAQGQGERFAVFASLLAVAGMICVCASVYLILKRLGGLKD